MKHNQRLFIPQKIASALLLAGLSFNAFAAPECEYELLSRSSDWVEQVKVADSSCYSSWFNAPEDAAIGIYSETSIKQVQRVLLDEVTQYDGDEQQAKRIANLSELIKAAYFARYSTQSNYGYYSEQLSRELAQISARFLSSQYAQSTGREQVRAMSAMSIMVDSVKQLPSAMPAMLDLLESFNRQNSQQLQYVDGLNNLFRAMNGHVARDYFYADVAAHQEYLVRLETFVDQNRWALGTDAEFLIYNAVRESGRLLASRDEKLRSQVMAFMKRTLARNAIGTEGERLWIAAAEMILFYAPEEGKKLKLEQSKSKLELSVLPYRYQCQGAAIIRSQNLSEQQSEKACEVLSAVEADFHQVVNSGWAPVNDDHNDNVEVVVWKDNDAYVAYSHFLFGNSTDNGGQYLEGDPSKPENVARFLAYRYDAGDELAILNLEHEYIHYLDGRFNLYGDFSDTLSSGHMVWWLEGFAEYMHYRQDYQAAVDLIEHQPMSLSEVIETTYEDDTNRIYRWGYLGVRFMLEEHPQHMARLLEFARKGDYATWSEQAKRLGVEFNSEFALWLETVSSTDSGSHNGDGESDPSPQDSAKIVSFGANHAQDYSANAYEEHLFYIDIPSEVTEFSVSIEGDGDADLYASYQSVAHYYEYQISDFQRGSNEEIKIQPQENGYIAPGRYYFSLTARESFESVRVTSKTVTRSPNIEQDDLTPKLMSANEPMQLKVKQTRYVGMYVERPATVRLWITAADEIPSNVDVFVGQHSWATRESFDVSGQQSDSNEFVQFEVEEAGYVHFTLSAEQQGGEVELYATY
ncbi:M9 family metallopeptidase [Vibrio neptunius]|uniref:microbial collagenase n=1 Tax=Vibrio neptunius TaxID=170651 RepID=A0ABS3A3W6_9VIBR|nr:M9 family metallopeptidase [Vibrio neptunius]MBN3493751.1 collagenase [Vibrio neptunius]MBN3516247.1 collagenase [Vibrio neptunius]MBN3550192.1 collagenase [Vibrio neptunius]MBN3578544.1 collagenase [Vibrio neptunius]MCH9872209.1 collagenase [Vibrio neptunius]